MQSAGGVLMELQPLYVSSSDMCSKFVAVGCRLCCAHQNHRGYLSGSFKYIKQGECTIYTTHCIVFSAVQLRTMKLSTSVLVVACTLLSGTTAQVIAIFSQRDHHTNNSLGNERVFLT